MTAGIPIIAEGGEIVGEIIGHSVTREDGKPGSLLLLGVLYSTGQRFTTAIRIEPDVPPFTLDTTARTPDPTPPTQARDV